MTIDGQEVVRSYFVAMRRGADGGADLFDLFTDDAVYIEPFTELGPAVGIDAIRERFRQGWEPGLADMELDILTMEIEGATASANWECRSPSLPGPVRGVDNYELLDGKIARLEVRILDEG